MPTRFVLLAVIASVSTLGALAQPKPTKPAKPEAAPPVPTLKFEVGKEVTVDDDALFDKHFILYVPKDYTPDREWPLIYCYHGVNQTAKVWPFKELTDGKGYIVVGMSYVAEKGGTTDQEWDSMLRIGKQVAASLKVNPRMQFIGGFSLGGMWTYRLSNKDPSMFAGICAMGMSGGPETSKAAAFAGKPVMVAHGENDEYCKNIDATIDGYTKVGAAVKHEVFKGQGHTVDTKNAVLKQWLLDVGPLRQVNLAFDAARATEKAGKIGPALAMYEAIAKTPDGGTHAKAAADPAKAITDVADKKFAEAEAAVTEKKYPVAVRTLIALEKSYGGSSVADRAKQRLTQIQTDPAIKAEIEQARVDAAADAAEAQAVSFERAKDFGRAIAVYERYVTEYPAAKRIEAVKTRLAALKADKSIQTAVAGKQVQTDCEGWLRMADNYAQAGLKDKARPYLQKVIDKYPTTDYAAAARKKLADLK